MEDTTIKYRFTIGENRFSLQVNEGDDSWNTVYFAADFPELVRAMADFDDTELTIQQKVSALIRLPRGITELIKTSLWHMEERQSAWGKADPSLSVQARLEAYQRLTITRNALWLLDRALE